MIQEIDQTIKNKINEYSNLKFGEKTVVTPYFINDKRRKDLRAMVGKGTPEEIVMEARIWEKLKGVHLSEMEPESIKQFLTDRGLGIDCSGFIVHILDSYFTNKKHKHAWNYLKIPNHSIKAKIRYMLRPVEQLGAAIITNSDNCYEVELKDIQPMDLIRCKSIKLNGDHIMIVSQVIKNDENLVTEIEYTHSTPHYGKLNGVKTGTIKITDINKPLEAQQWQELDESGVCHTLEGYKKDTIDNGIRRLKALD